MDPTAGIDPMALLQYLSQQPGGLDNYFEPYQQEQDLLGQGAGAQHSSPLGALLGGLSDAAGKFGGAVINKRMQTDASGRVKGLLDLLKKQQAMGGPMATPDLEEAVELGG